jgi:hypothetical protein
MVKDSQDKLRGAQDQDEPKKEKFHRAMRLLESSFNLEASTMLQNIDQGREILLEQVNFSLFHGILIDEEPSSFDEAWNYESQKAGGKLQDAIKKELCDMDEQQVWWIIKKIIG